MNELRFKHADMLKMYKLTTGHGFSMTATVYDEREKEDGTKENVAVETMTFPVRRERDEIVFGKPTHYERIEPKG